MGHMNYWSHGFRMTSGSLGCEAIIKMAYCDKICSVLLEYDTSKIVHIKSKKVGLINRLIQLAIIAYVIG